MANLSQIKREQMLNFLETLKVQHTDDASLMAINQIEKELTAKKYGLVWEEHEELVDERIKTEIPVFIEKCEKEILVDNDNPHFNFLLQGDNLHSLKLLEKTHKGKIGVIYIDPPYNTGNKDFIYEDSFVDKNDGYIHSKWISFIYKRLQCAKNLLADDGLIFISIDDNEVADLKLICNEIFGESNFRGQIVRSTGTPTGQGNSILVNEIDYILVYSRTDKAFFNGMPFSEEDAKIYNCEDEYGKYLVRPLRKTGGEDRREDRPSMYYEVLAPDGTKVYPIAPAGYESRWRCAYSTYLELCTQNRIEWKKDKDGWKVYQKFYLEGRTKQPSNLWTKIEGNKKATITIKNIFGKSVFDFPKPVELIKQILTIAGKKDSLVLDFFAGSGTTAQAVLEQNKEDGGNRRFILCTNNENNICENVTYQRIKTVITGYRQDGSIYSNGIPSNLKYYVTDFVEKDSENLVDDLMEHITEMIQLQFGVKVDNEKYVIILDDDDMDDFEVNIENYTELKAVFISQDVLLSTQQERMLLNINVFTIPDCYFDFELREAGELW